ncbi:hypothetical protein AAF712_015637 [Marasmius tenuissimus]|uniref:Uncharacterized protein n=1 Tax=Marasmius tenuissimus TaxID=585030 RepID=A0ABR2Z8Y1_9AGAR
MAYDPSISDKCSSPSEISRLVADSSQSSYRQTGTQYINFGRDQNINTGSGTLVVNHSYAGATVTIFHGDQIISEEGNMKRTEYDEFHSVIRGAIYKKEDLGIAFYPRRSTDATIQSPSDSQLAGRRLKADRWIYTAEVNKELGKDFTVMSYSGPDAQKAFEEDFLIYSKSHSFTFQLYGHNRSEIPSLIFWKVLLPAATFGSDLGFWGKVYIRALRDQHQCQDHELWLDVEKGVICRGPKGPYHEPSGPSSISKYVSLPDLADLLQEDTSLRFWASLKSADVDREVVVEILQPWRCDPERPVIEPTVFQAWNFEDGDDRVGVDERIAVGNVSWTSWSCALGEREVFESRPSGLTRFVLRHNPHRHCKIRLAQDEWEERRAWVTQAFCVLHARGVSKKGDVNIDDSFGMDTSILLHRTLFLH